MKLICHPSLTLTFLVSSSFLPALFSHSSLDNPNPVPCKQPENELVGSMARSFRKLSPRYMPETVSVVIPGDDLQMTLLSPENPNLLTYLQQYPNIVKFAVDRHVKLENDKQLRTSLMTVLVYDYFRFLQNYGTRLACISYLLGVTDDFRVVENIAKNAEYLESVFGNRSPQDDAMVFEPARGLEILGRLKLLREADEPDSSFEGGQGQTASNRGDCLDSDIVTYAEDNTVFVRFPSVSALPTKLTLAVPGREGEINAAEANVTRVLEEYYRETLRCLKTSESKLASSKKLLEYISAELVPEALRSRQCVHGFHRLLNLVRLLNSHIRSRLLDKADSGNPTSVVFSEPVAPFLEIHGSEKSRGVLLRYTGFLIFLFILLLLVLLLCVLCWKETIFGKCEEGYRWIYAYWVKEKWKKSDCLSSCCDDKVLMTTSSSSCNSEQSWKGRCLTKDTSRDIYIQLTERPCEITATETECEFDDKVCTVDEFSIFKTARPGKPPKRSDFKRIVTNQYCSCNRPDRECEKLLQTESEESSSDSY